MNQFPALCLIYNFLIKQKLSFTRLPWLPYQIRPCEQPRRCRALQSGHCNSSSKSQRWLCHGKHQHSSSMHSYSYNTHINNATSSYGSGASSFITPLSMSRFSLLSTASLPSSACSNNQCSANKCSFNKRSFFLNLGTTVRNINSRGSSSNVYGLSSFSTRERIYGFNGNSELVSSVISRATSGSSTAHSAVRNNKGDRSFIENNGFIKLGGSGSILNISSI